MRVPEFGSFVQKETTIQGEKRHIEITATDHDRR
jgi:hypothetical protein